MSAYYRGVYYAEKCKDIKTQAIPVFLVKSSPSEVTLVLFPESLRKTAALKRCVKFGDDKMTDKHW